MNKKTLKQIRAEMLNLPQNEFWPVGPEAGQFLMEQVAIHNPKKLLELGTSSGYSTTWLLEGLADQTAEIITIESNLDRYNLAQEFFKQIDHKNIKISHVRHHAPEVFPELNLENLDFVFCDAIKKQTLNLYQLLRSYMTPEAIFIVDNAISHKESMQDFYDYLNQNNIQYDLIDKGAGLILISNNQFQ